MNRDAEELPLFVDSFGKWRGRREFSNSVFNILEGLS
jgi:hypothetical protein